ncbi:ankyrin repeat domain-containing protein [Wolbachia pipientis]|uniref:ankyrin repeat domain-containing protein n=1 Tax=Wolbachia pipientis TaxID=955 RepID=UPI0025A3187C|nr:ankyrin repeat domain-containing protein [Wolbachia pipientis]MDM8335741.1 ankyrin repeat domain-containing protein [Wolbachia pipientis]
MGYGRNKANINSYGYNRRAPEPLDAPTKKLFKAIDDEDLEGFRQAIEEGADVNAFDKEGMTPLMSIANVCVVSGDGQATLEKMSKLLMKNSSVDINIQSKQFETVTRSKYNFILLDEVSEFIITPNKRKDTALHVACQVGAKDIVKILLTHPGIKTDIRNCEYKKPEGCIERGSRNVIKLEFEKAQKGKQLLKALSNRNIYQAKVLLNEQFNPNCWRRNTRGEMRTFFDLITESCSEGITEDKKEVLIKLLKHKDLDFSQIKSTPAIEQNIQLKQIVEQAIKERLTDAIDRKDLDDVEKLVEDNCFINRGFVTAVLRDVNNLIAPITNYLNEKFPASAAQPLANTHNITPEVNEEFIAQESQQLKSPNELEGTRTQVTEKDVRHNLDKRRESRSCIKKESDEPQRAVFPDRKQSNCASIFFILSGAFAIIACLAIEDYPAISACFVAIALVLFLVGYVLYDINKQDIELGGATDNPQITRVLISSPNSAENFYTC